ncbi:nucleotidyltransferase domain-containing protein [Halorhodospira halochloris]|uniref:DNA polymerase n=1 Tax=Halorhodospira halochloris TaxID=1052 RepID=A0A0X8X7I3_HALHR|nr:nucleotidyltransferase domain-containing protein [Halorhodospira halochloris]MBK1652887.1 hypothetical protein [Halorhodospira halochloris]MCG5531320.1 nucleotidyltransferase domain-containing protein [Halorhodospira halochloris]BAU57014.1 DNA polymerase [Halorhodospira halochloris]
MRLTSAEREVILDVAREVLGDDVKVRLFGSRVDDSARGGDIDLLIECDEQVQNRASAASRVAALLQMRLGDQRIDVLILDPSTTRLPVHDEALREGVEI